jgi:hypothetical protein
MSATAGPGAGANASRSSVRILYRPRWLSIRIPGYHKAEVVSVSKLAIQTWCRGSRSVCRGATVLVSEHGLPSAVAEDLRASDLDLLCSESLTPMVGTAQVMGPGLHIGELS